MFEIREIKPGEHEFLFEMLYEAIYIPDGEEKLPRSVVDEPYLSKYVDDFGRQGDLAFVLTNEDQLVGAIWIRLFSEEEKSYGFVDASTPELSMALKENYRGSGFGTQLIETVFSKLKNDGVEKISLSVDKQNRAVRLYRRVGFEIFSEEGTAYTMVKKL
jgi:ribosomal protein S18 acetylase RimI-like enzyme